MLRQKWRASLAARKKRKYEAYTACPSHEIDEAEGEKRYLAASEHLSLVLLFVHRRINLSLHPAPVTNEKRRFNLPRGRRIYGARRNVFLLSHGWLLL